MHSPDLLRHRHDIGMDRVFIGFKLFRKDETKAAYEGGTIAHDERANKALRKMGVA